MSSFENQLEVCVKSLFRYRKNLDRCIRIYQDDAMAIKYIYTEISHLAEPYVHFCSQVKEAILDREGDTLEQKEIIQKDYDLLTRVEPHIITYLKQGYSGEEKEDLNAILAVSELEQQASTQLKKSLNFQLWVYDEYTRLALAASSSVKIMYSKYWLGRIHTAFLGVEYADEPQNKILGESLLTPFAFKLAQLSYPKRVDIKSELNIFFQILYRKKHSLPSETILTDGQGIWRLSSGIDCNTYASNVNYYADNILAIDDIITQIYKTLARIR